MDMARERISLILDLMAMFLSFQKSSGTAAVVLAILDVQYFRLITLTVNLAVRCEGCSDLSLTVIARDSRRAY